MKARRRFWRFVAVGPVTCVLGLAPAAVSGHPQKSASEPSRPNVLFIVADDLNTSLSGYGHPVVRSPHIDRLAMRGVRFDRAYTQYPLCNPSRASFLTGLRPSTTRVFDLQAHFRSAVPEAVTLPQLFRQSGYFTARVGKIFHQGVPSGIGTSGPDDLPSWDHVVNPRGRDKDQEDLVINLTPKRALGIALSFLESGDPDDVQTDALVATETIRLLEENRHKAFFLAAGFYRPHSPWIAPKAYFDLYRQAEVEPPALGDDLNDIPAPALWLTPERLWATEGLGSPPNYGLSQGDLRRSRAAYYASVTFLDAQVGRLLDALDRLDLTQRTIVVFLGDHGFHLGEHGLWAKRSLFEESARAPLIVVAPGIERGVAADVVEFVDIFPTVAELAGVKPPSRLEGVSLKPVLEEPTLLTQRAAFTEVRRPEFFGHSVRTRRWRYTEWDHGRQGIELYDHEGDPDERRNLAGTAELSRQEAQLRALVREHWHGPTPLWGGNP